MLIATNGICYVEELVKTHSEGGLHLPQTSKRKTVELCSGIVYALDKEDEAAKGIEIGDTVIYPPMASQIPLRINGKDLIAIGTRFIAGIIAHKGDVTGFANNPISLSLSDNN